MFTQWENLLQALFQRLLPEIERLIGTSLSFELWLAILYTFNWVASLEAYAE